MDHYVQFFIVESHIRHGALHHRQLNWLLNSLFNRTRTMSKIPKLRITVLCQGNPSISTEIPSQRASNAETQIAMFLGSTWGPSGSCRRQMGPMLAPWTLLSGKWFHVMTSPYHWPVHQIYKRKVLYLFVPRSPHIQIYMMIPEFHGIFTERIYFQVCGKR